MPRDMTMTFMIDSCTQKLSIEARNVAFCRWRINLHHGGNVSMSRSWYGHDTRAYSNCLMASIKLYKWISWKGFLTVSNHSTVHFYVPDELLTDLTLSTISREGFLELPPPMSSPPNKSSCQVGLILTSDYLSEEIINYWFLNLTFLISVKRRLHMTLLRRHVIEIWLGICNDDQTDQT